MTRKKGPEAPNLTPKVMNRIARVNYDAGPQQEAAALHRDTYNKLIDTIRRVGLVSENMKIKEGIESKLEIIEPISKRDHEKERIKRSQLFRGRTPGLQPKPTFRLGNYTHNDVPFSPTEPVRIESGLFELKRESSAWVLPFALTNDYVTRRRPNAPSWSRRHDLIIEVPEKGAPIKSWAGGVVPKDGQPAVPYVTEIIDGKTKTYPAAPRKIGTGKDGEGTLLTPKGHRGASGNGFHAEHAIETLTAIHTPYVANTEYDRSPYTQTGKLKSYIGAMLLVQGRVLDRIAEEQGVAEYPDRVVPRPAHLGPPAY